MANAYVACYSVIAVTAYANLTTCMSHSHWLFDRAACCVVLAPSRGVLWCRAASDLV